MSKNTIRPSLLKKLPSHTGFHQVFLSFWRYTDLMKSSNPSTPILVSIAAAAVIIGAASYVFIIDRKDADRLSSSTAQTTHQSSSVPASATSSPPTRSSGTPSSPASYKDGSYTASASYRVPNGQNSITVKITVAGGVISTVSSTHKVDSRESEGYTDWFNKDITSVAVGKPLGTLSLSRVGGASLTTEGFNQALSSILNDARAT